ncbi:MAG: DUF4747 family protein [Sulfurospirillum cavolei]|nr:DUF4747 family protein [Sulfurospirillum cavolei]
MKLFFVNVQMLPVKNDAQELGVEGYFDLLKLLYKEYNDGELGILRYEKYIEFYSIDDKTSDNFCKGQLRICKKAKPYKDKETHKVTAIPSKNDVQDDPKIGYFFFDLENHIMAVQKIPNEIISGKTLETKIRALFQKRINATNQYKDYYLDIVVLTQMSELEKILDEDRVSYLNVNLSFPNSEQTQDQLLEELKKERSGIEYKEKAFPDSEMRGISSLGKRLALYATKYGNVTMKYFDKSKNKLTKFILRDQPIESNIKNPEDEHLFTDVFMREEVKNALDQAWKQKE